jgi:hypothetical protein
MIKETTALGFPVDVAELRIHHCRAPASRSWWPACRKMQGHGTTATMTSDIFDTNTRAILEIGRLGELDSSIPPYKERTLRQLRAGVFLAPDFPHRQG